MSRLTQLTQLSLIALLAPLTLSACDNGGPDPDTDDPGTDSETSASAVHAVKITVDSLFLQPGDDGLPVTAEAFDVDGAVFDAGQVSWSVDGSAAAIADGVVSGTSVGTAYVTATIDGVPSAPIPVVVARLAGDSVSIPDASITSFEVVDETATFGLGFQVRVQVDDSVSVQAGQLVVAHGDTPLAGRVVSVDGTTLIVETVSPADFFAEADIDIDIDVPVTSGEINDDGLFDYTIDETGTLIFTPVPSTDYSALGFDCTTKVDHPILTIAAPSIKLKPTWSYQLAFDGIKPEKVIVSGQLESEVSATLELELGVEAEVTCARTMWTVTVPLSGPMSWLFAGKVPIQAVIQAKGKATVADYEIKPQFTAKGSISLGLECTGTECVAPDVWSGTTELKTEWDEGSPDKRAEIEVGTYVGAKFGFGPPLLAKGFEAVDAKIGARAKLDYARVTEQIDDPGYASEYALEGVVEAKAGKEIKRIRDFLKIKFPAPSIERIKPLAVSPRGSIDVPDDIEEGTEFEVDIDFSDSTFLGAYAIEEVIIARREADGWSKEATLTPTGEQTEFTWKYTPDADDMKGATFAVMVDPILFWNPLEVAKDATIKIGGTCEPSLGAPQIAVQSGGDLTSIDPLSGSINDDGTVAFTGRNSVGSGVWLTDDTGSELLSFQSSKRSFGGAAINNDGWVLARDRYTNSPPIYHIRLWEKGGAHDIIGGSPEEFDSVTHWADVNNKGQAVYLGLVGGSTQLSLMAWDGAKQVELKRWSDRTRRPRAQLSDAGQAVYRDADDQLVVHAIGGASSTVVSGASGLSERPGISAVGGQVAFVADLDGGEALHIGVPGSSWTVHEVLTDELDDYDENSRVGIAWQADECGGMSTLIVAGSKDGVQGVWASHVQADDSGVELLDHEALVRVGDTVGGKVVSTVHTWDPISRNGNVVVRVGFEDGSSALLRWMRGE